MVSLTNFKRVRDQDELALGSYDNPVFAGNHDQDLPVNNDLPIGSSSGLFAPPVTGRSGNNNNKKQQKKKSHRLSELIPTNQHNDAPVSQATPNSPATEASLFANTSGTTTTLEPIRILVESQCPADLRLKQHHHHNNDNDHHHQHHHHHPHTNNHQQHKVINSSNSDRATGQQVLASDASAPSSRSIKSAKKHSSLTAKTGERSHVAQVSPGCSSNSGAPESLASLSSSQSQVSSVDSSGRDSGVIEHQQSAISFYSSASSPSSSSSSSSTAASEAATTIATSNSNNSASNTTDHNSPTTSNSSSLDRSARRRSSVGAALEGVTDDDVGSFAGGPLEEPLTAGQLRAVGNLDSHNCNDQHQPRHYELEQSNNNRIKSKSGNRNTPPNDYYQKNSETTAATATTTNSNNSSTNNNNNNNNKSSLTKHMHTTIPVLSAASQPSVADDDHQQHRGHIVSVQSNLKVAVPQIVALNQRGNAASATITSNDNNEKQQQQQHQQQFQQVNSATKRNNSPLSPPLSNRKLHNSELEHCESPMGLDDKRGHFEIRWNDLYYQVEPKWYQQKWPSLSFSWSGKPTQSHTKLPPSSVVGVDNKAAISDDDDERHYHLNRHHDDIDDLASSSPAPAIASTPRRANKTVSILNNLNGSVRSGQVTAILGPSGAGKTSLLGCLTGKNRTGVSGTIQVKGGTDKPLSICTIPQKDYLLNQLTVRENLWFASRLKHPEDNFDHDTNINRVLALLKLESCVDTKISKISGGQYKRVSIAQELLSNPDILILDEPTSGLDSLTCYKTVMVLRDLAQLSPNPMAIIVTIHQPQREVFDLFNHVYILAVGGQAIYEGRPSQSIETINKCSAGTSLQFDASSYNPASYLVEIASAEFGFKPIEALAEHQLREFKRRTQEQDYRQYQLMLLQQQQQQSTPTMGYSFTPGGHRKRESPIVARFKSTFGLGSHNLQQQQLQLHPASMMTMADVNTSTLLSTPYDSPMSLHKTSLPTIHEPSLAERNIHQQQQHHQQQLYNTTTGGMFAGDSRLELTGAGLGSQRHLSLASSASSSTIGGFNTIGSDLNNISGGTGATTKSQGSGTGSGEFFLDERLETHKHNHDGHFYRHCRLLTKRSWLCLCKDPMLTTLRFAAHIFVPLLITLVYGNRVGKPNACPLYESDMDLIDYAKRGATRLLGLQDELRCTFENVGLYFLSIYAFTFSTMCLTSLSFPLNMHVLLKEVRNGWYSIPTFFIGKTLADFPLEFILPTVTLVITYPLTGQPSSYMEWRFLVGTAIFVLTSLIAQTQGLIFGALFMNAMQAAVFVAPVSTTPLILLSGFLIRIGQMPRYLQILSSFSYFRYAIEGLTIVRYGFNMCPCDPEIVTGQPVTASGVPEQLRTMTNYWLSTFNVENNGNNNDDDIITTTTTATTLDYSLLQNNATALATSNLINNNTVAETAATETDFFQDLTVLLARANSFGANITTCQDLKPYPMIDFNLKDEQLYVWMAGLVATLLVSKVINYLVVKYSVKFRL